MKNTNYYNIQSYGNIYAGNIAAWAHLKLGNLRSEKGEGRDRGVPKEDSADPDMSQSSQTTGEPV